MQIFFRYSHYIVPELGPDVKFCYASHKAVNEFKEAKSVSFLDFISTDAS